MSTDDITGDPRFDGRPVDDWARSWEVPRVVAFTSVGSTMDVAHALAREGASDGTVVVADTQQAGRGRNGRPWRAPSGGLWCSVLLRPTAQQPFDGATLGVFTLRIGLSLAVVLDDVIGGASPAVRLKWPNDLWWSGGKLGGILTEAHWEGARLGWLVVGVGINRALPPGRGSTDLAPPIALPSALPRGTLLGVMVGAVRRAATWHGMLDAGELAAYASRDVLRGRRVMSPVEATVSGIARDGGLQLRLGDGALRTIRTGEVRLAFAEPADETPGR